MRRLLLASIILSVASLAIAADAPKSSETSRPTWCRSGYICLQTSEVADDAAYHYDLQEQVLRYKQRARRFGLTVGLGFGVGGVVSDDYDVQWTPVGGAFVVYGFRW